MKQLTIPKSLDSQVALLKDLEKVQADGSSKHMGYQGITASLSKLRAEVSAKAKAHSTALKTLDNLLKALKDPSKNAIALAEAVTSLKKDGKEVLAPGTYEATIRELEQCAKQELDKAEFAFNRDLRATFEEHGIPLKGSPGRYVADPLLIEVDKKGNKVNLKWGHETLNVKPIALDPKRVFDEYERASKSLTGRKTNLKELLELFFEAYRHVILTSGGQIGDRVNIVDCYRGLVWLKQSPSFKRLPSKASFSDYPRAHFAYDIFQLRRNTILTHKKYRLQFGTATIDATGDASRAMWIPESAEEGRYIMDIYWTKETA